VRRFKRAKDIKVGVVGYSGAYNMGRRHLQEMAAAGMTPTAVAEVVPERLRAAEEEFPGIETYSSLKAMLKKSDVHLVAMITPHNTHAPLALEALRGGRHAVLEKPMAVTTAECDAMLRAARKRRLVVTTYHNRHWDGCIMNAVKRIRGGLIGEVVRIEAHMGRWGAPRDWWRSSRKISGGTLFDWGVHILEYSMQLIDAPMVEVSGFAKTGFWSRKSRYGRDTNEDEAFATVRFKTGQWLTLCITNIDSNPKKGVLEITGTKGSFVFDHRTWEAVTHDGDQVVRTSGQNPDGQGWRFYKNVADHLVRGRKLVITPEWGRRMIHVLDLAVRSAEQGRALKVKYK
jgi:predicted dehydrogenase